MLPENYQPPTLTVDNVIFQLIDSELHVLLGIVTSDPFRGEWALPGGFCSNHETTRQAVDRILTTKAGIDTGKLGMVEQLYAFDAINEDERGHTFSIAYLGLGKDMVPRIEDGVPCSVFTPVKKLPPIAYDQGSIIDHGLSRLQAQLETTNVMVTLMPELFTLAKLQEAYESIFGRSFNKPNFRKRLLSYNILEATDQKEADGAHRPARIYRFRDTKVMPVNHHFT